MVARTMRLRTDLTTRGQLAGASGLWYLQRMTCRVPRIAELEAILLDYGGTLDGDAQHWFDHFVRLYAEVGIEMARERIKTAFYTADAALTRSPDIATYGLERMVRGHVDHQFRHLELTAPTLAERLADRFIDDTRTAWNRNRPLLGRLAERYRLGVVSNSYGNMPALLAEAALAPFAVVLDSALVGIAKPDPALYALATTELDLSPATILHVGDSWERDVVPANATGMQTAWLASLDAPMPPLPTGVWRLGSLLDLAALLP
jgi:FMN phosphatase YigB (HAD superfamily)